MTQTSSHDGTPTEVKIRLATDVDLDELARLRWAMTDEMIGATEPRAAFEARFGAFAQRTLTGDTWAVWVAERDARLLGMVWVQLVDRVPRPIEAAPAYAYITSVFVESDERNLGLGLGRRILDAAVGWIREQDVDSVILWPSERSGPFYERAGFGPSNAVGLGR